MWERKLNVELFESRAETSWSGLVMQVESDPPSQNQWGLIRLSPKGPKGPQSAQQEQGPPYGFRDICSYPLPARAERPMLMHGDAGDVGQTK
jgi:hypothetical protein